MSRKRIESPFMAALRFANALEPSDKKALIEALTVFVDAPAVKAEPGKRKEKIVAPVPELLGKAH